MKRYAGICTAFLCGFILLILSLIWQNPGNLSGIKNWVRVFSNAALIPGVLLTGIGCLIRISDENFFDGVKYSVSSLLSHLRHEPKRYDSYYDYIHREKKKGGARPLLISGGFYLALAVVLTLFFYL